EVAVTVNIERDERRPACALEAADGAGFFEPAAEVFAVYERGQVGFTCKFSFRIAGRVTRQRRGGVHQPARRIGRSLDPKAVGQLRDHGCVPSGRAGSGSVAPASGAKGLASTPAHSKCFTLFVSLPSSSRRSASLMSTRMPGGNGCSNCSGEVMPI